MRGDGDGDGAVPYRAGRCGAGWCSVSGAGSAEDPGRMSTGVLWCRLVPWCCTQVRQDFGEQGRHERVGGAGKSALERDAAGGRLRAGGFRAVGAVVGVRFRVREGAVPAAGGLAVGLGVDALFHRGGQGPDQ